MASIQQGPVKGRRRPLDASLNLVPFIDLLSCCIAFLLITAVWSQVSAMEVPMAGGAVGENVEPAKKSPTLRVHKTGYTVESTTVAGLRELDEALRRIGGDALTVSADDDVDYGRLIEAIDRAKGAGYAVGITEG